MPPVALTRELFAGDGLSVLLRGDRDLPVPRVCQLPGPSYDAAAFFRERRHARMAAMPMAGMAGMKNVTVTSAPVTGLPSGRSA